jgi:hypothetical protein
MKDLNISTFIRRINVENKNRAQKNKEKGNNIFQDVTERVNYFQPVYSMHFSDQCSQFKEPT